MAPRLIREGKVQVLGETLNNVVYAVASGTKTGWAKDNPIVLKGGSVCIYEALGQHDSILKFLGLEMTPAINGYIEPCAVRLERAPHGALRDRILKSEANPPSEQTRLSLAVQFATGVAHLHNCGIIWGDLSTRNALLFDDWRLKLCDFADSDTMDNYRNYFYACEDRYYPPGSARPQFHEIGKTIPREIFALGSAIYEIMEWEAPYGPQRKAYEKELLAALIAGIWPQISNGNPAEDVIRRCWEYKYDSSQQVVDDLNRLIYLKSATTLRLPMSQA